MLPRIAVLLLFVPVSAGAQVVTTQGIDRMGDLTLKITHSGLPPGTAVTYTLDATVSVAYQCVRKGQVVPVDIMVDTTLSEQWTAVAKTTGTIRTAVTLFLPDLSSGLCSAGWTAEPTWVRYGNLALFDEQGVLVTIGSYERFLK
jgi:hypothetical protein